LAPGSAPARSPRLHTWSPDPDSPAALYYDHSALIVTAINALRALLDVEEAAKDYIKVLTWAESERCEMRLREALAKPEELK